MLDYFKSKYNIALNPKQPVLCVHRYDSDIYLPTEKCHIASLPTNFTKDAFKMRAIREYKISDPTERVQRILTLMKTIEQNSIMTGLGITLEG